jgi:hypothetical protein
MGTGSFPRVKCGRGVLLTTHPLLAPAELYLYPPLGHNRACSGVTLPVEVVVVVVVVLVAAAAAAVVVMVVVVVVVLLSA